MDEAEPGDRDRLPDGMCVMPWLNLHVSTLGEIMPCCEFKGDIGNLREDTLAESWRGDRLRAIREAFARGEPLAACGKCMERERYESDSLRLQANRRFAAWLDAQDARTLARPADFPVALDIRFTNLCNFSCRSCWHGASSKWFQDGKAIGSLASDRAETRSFASFEEFFAQIEQGVDGIVDLYFAGGEPLMMEEHYRFLDRLIELGRTDVALRYHTNMSVTSFRGRSVFDLWKRFPNVLVIASVDAHGERGELLRRGFEWKLFVANMRALRRKCPHVAVDFGITVSALNILSLADLLRALESECGARPADFDIHSLQEPPYYRTDVLPRRLKARAAASLEAYIGELERRDLESDPGTLVFVDRLRGAIRMMRPRADSRHRRRLARTTAALDGLRRERTAAVLPELAPALRDWRRIIRGALGLSPR
ncbi:MAG: twitch domain-containing radical SAM protein [Flavobacteriaceae bacterium]